MTNQHSEVVREFLIESYENLDRLDRILVDLERTPDDRDKLADVFRTIHTIKGTCGLLGYLKLEAVSHVGENLLSRLRDGDIRLNGARTTALLRLVDAVRELLAAIESTGEEGDGDYRDVVAELTHVNRASDAPPEAQAAPDGRRPDGDGAVPEGPGGNAESPAADRRLGDDRRQHPDAGLADSSLRVDVGLLDRVMNLVGELVLARNQILQFKDTQTD